MALTLINAGDALASSQINQCVNAINGIQTNSASGVTANPTTASTTPVQLTDMTVAITTTVSGISLAWFSASVKNSGSNGVFAQIYLDGVAAGAISYAFTTTGAQVTCSAVWTNVSAGNHTWRVFWYVDGGTGIAIQTYRQLSVLVLP